MTDRDSSAKAEDAGGMALQALETALRPVEGAITAAVETQIERALHMMRASRIDRHLLNRFERAAASLRLMAEAKRTGCPNLYRSRLLRLRREFLA
jgi:hypothetical protein